MDARLYAGGKVILLFAQVNHYIVGSTGQDCFRRLIGNVALYVGHVSRDEYEVASIGIYILFEVFAE